MKDLIEGFAWGGVFIIVFYGVALMAQTYGLAETGAWVSK